METELREDMTSLIVESGEVLKVALDKALKAAGRHAVWVEGSNTK